MGFLDRDSKPGDALLASDVNAIKQALRRGNLVTVDGQTSLRTAGGTVVRQSGRRQPRIAKISADIPPRSGTTLGSGTARLYDRSGATLVDTGIDVTAYNLSGTKVTSGRYLILLPIQGGWLVDFEDCT